MRNLDFARSGILRFLPSVEMTENGHTRDCDIASQGGIQSFQTVLDPGASPGPRSGIRRGDGVTDVVFLKLTALGPTQPGKKENL